MFFSADIASWSATTLRLKGPLSWPLSVFLLLPATQELPGQGVLHFLLLSFSHGSFGVIPNFAVLQSTSTWTKINHLQNFSFAHHITWVFHAKNGYLKAYNLSLTSSRTFRRPQPPSKAPGWWSPTDLTPVDGFSRKPLAPFLIRSKYSPQNTNMALEQWCLEDDFCFVLFWSLFKGHLYANGCFFVWKDSHFRQYSTNGHLVIAGLG